MARLEYRLVATRLRTDCRLAPATDAELLARFAATRDEAAFAELVARHAGLVRGTARRALRDPHAAEDVYQATFLVLAKKVGSVRWGATVGPWLHATAVRLARKAASCSSPAPGVVADHPAPRVDPAAAAAWGEVCRALDEEVAALPEVLRGPLVLCYLQDRTRDEAAAALGCSLAMLKRRLERGRNLLRDRLTRRGVALPAVGTAVLITELPVSASAAASTARAAAEYTATGTVAPGTAALLATSRSGLWVKATALAAGLMVCALASGAFSRLPGTDSRDDSKPAPTAGPTKTDAAADPLPPGAVARLGTLRLRPGASVRRLAFSPDGAKLASWSNALIIWDTKTGAALRRVDLPGVVVDLLVWLADGRGIALVRSDYDDPAPLIWEFTDEKAEKPPVKPRKQGGLILAPIQVEDNEHDSCYAVSPDGKALAIGKAGQLERDRDVQLWELKTGVKVDKLKPLKGGVIHPGNVGAIHFTPDAKTLVVFTELKYRNVAADRSKWETEQLVTVWDLATSKEKTRFTAPPPAKQGARMTVALSNKLLAIGLDKGDTSLWDLKTGKENKLATGHDSKKPGGGYGTFAAAFAPDGKTLATGGRDNVTKLWDVATGKLLHTLERHYSWVEVLAVSPDGKLVASSGQDGIIRLWDAATGKDACPLPGHLHAVWHTAFSADGKTAITASLDNTVRWWDPATGIERRVVTVPGGVMGLALSPDAKTVLVATDDGKLRTWDADTGRETTPADLPADAKFKTLAFTPDRKYLVASSGPKVTIWEWPELKLARTIDLPAPKNQPGENDCQVAAVSPDGKWLVTVAERYWFRDRDGLRLAAAADGVVDLWDFATGKRVRRLADGKGTFRSGMFTADGRFALIGGGGTIPAHEGRGEEEFSGEINLLDPVAGRWVRGFDVPKISENVQHRYSGGSALSPDGSTLYVGYNTGEIIAFEVATGKPRRTLAGHSNYVASLAFSPDGRRLISGSSDGTALVWDVTLAGDAPRKPPARRP